MLPDVFIFRERIDVRHEIATFRVYIFECEWQGAFTFYQNQLIRFLNDFAWRVSFIYAHKIMIAALFHELLFFNGKVNKIAPSTSDFRHFKYEIH